MGGSAGRCMANAAYVWVGDVADEISADLVLISSEAVHTKQGTSHAADAARSITTAAADAAADAAAAAAAALVAAAGVAPGACRGGTEPQPSRQRK
uniref:Uncharacterized protein n=1 Tax=Tetradesmus obliquus TaxID=3088 RepID=A0A383VHL9_TETOB